MNRQTAERLIAATLALDPLLGEIDQVISEMPDSDSKKTSIKGLGEVFRVLNETFIIPVGREYPDLAEKD